MNHFSSKINKKMELSSITPLRETLMSFREFHTYLTYFNIKQLYALYRVDQNIMLSKTDFIRYVYDNIRITKDSVDAYKNQHNLTFGRPKKILPNLIPYASILRKHNYNEISVSSITAKGRAPPSKPEKIIGNSFRKYSLKELQNISGSKYQTMRRLCNECGLALMGNHTLEDYIYRLDSFYNGDNLVNMRCMQGFRYISTMDNPLGSTYIQIYNYIVENVHISSLSMYSLSRKLQISRKSIETWRSYKIVNEAEWIHRPEITASPAIYASENGEIRNFISGCTYTYFSMDLYT